MWNQLTMQEEKGKSATDEEGSKHLVGFSAAFPCLSKFLITLSDFCTDTDCLVHEPVSDLALLLKLLCYLSLKIADFV